MTVGFGVGTVWPPTMRAMIGLTMSRLYRSYCSADYPDLDDLETFGGRASEVEDQPVDRRDVVPQQLGVDDVVCISTGAGTSRTTAWTTTTSRMVTDVPDAATSGVGAPKLCGAGTGEPVRQCGASGQQEQQRTDRALHGGAVPCGPVDVGGDEPVDLRQRLAQNGHPMVQTRCAPVRAASIGMGWSTPSGRAMSCAWTSTSNRMLR